MDAWKRGAKDTIRKTLTVNLDLGEWEVEDLVPRIRSMDRVAVEFGGVLFAEIRDLVAKKLGRGSDVPFLNVGDIVGGRGRDAAVDRVAVHVESPAVRRVEAAVDLVLDATRAVIEDVARHARVGFLLAVLVYVRLEAAARVTMVKGVKGRYMRSLEYRADENEKRRQRGTHVSPGSPSPVDSACQACERCGGVTAAARTGAASDATRRTLRSMVWHVARVSRAV